MTPRKISFLVLLLAAVFAPMASVNAAVPVGTVTKVMGRAYIITEGERPRAASVGEPVRVGDVAFTRAASKMEVEFEKGDLLRVGENTRVEISDFVETEEKSRGLLSLFRGKIESVVKRAAFRLFGRDKENKFEVATPTAVCGVRGTDFFTWHKEGVSGAAVKEGELYGYSKERPEDVVYVSRGQSMRVVSPEEPPQVYTTPEGELREHEQDTSLEEAEGEDDTEGAPPPEDTAVEEDDEETAEETPEEVAGEGAGGEDMGDVAELDEEDLAGLETEPLAGDQDVTGETDTSAGQDTYIPPEIPQDIVEEPEPGTTQLIGEISAEGILDEGVVRASVSDETDSGTVSLSGSGPVPVDRTQVMTFGGTLGSGGYSEGILGGSLGSWSGVLSALYVDEEGGVGFLSGKLSGTWMDGVLSADGTAERIRTPASTDLAPSELYPALTDSGHSHYEPFFETMYVPLPGDIGSGMVEPGDLGHVHGMGLRTAEGSLLGVWGVSDAAGYYSDPSTVGEWTGFFTDMGDNPIDGYPHYTFGPVTVKDDGAGRLTLEGTLTYMDFYRRGTIGLNYTATYDTAYGDYTAAGTGTWTGEPLTFAGRLNGGLGRVVPGTLYSGNYYNPWAGDGGFFSYNWNKRGWRKYHDGMNYTYEYIATNQGAGSGYKAFRDLTAERVDQYRYYPWGTYSHFSNQPVPAILERSGSWDIAAINDLSDPPGTDYEQRLQHSEQRPSNSLESTGSLFGILGGTGVPWSATQADPAQVYGAGKFIDTGEEGAALIADETWSENPDDGSPVTPDGGRYSGYVGGVADTQGSTAVAVYAIYKDPSGNAGILTGNLEGAGYNGMDMWEAQGGIYPVYSTPYQGEFTDETGLIRVQEVKGDFGGTGSIQGQGLGGETLSLLAQDQDWGVFMAELGYDMSFSNPQEGSTWTASLSGAGEFGSYQTNSASWTPDFGVFVADTGQGTWSGGKLNSGLSGKFLTLTKLGEMSGRVHGSYDAEAGDWQALAIGGWQKTEDLTFSSYLEGQGYMSMVRESDYYLMEDDSRYEFGSEKGTGYTWVYFDDRSTGETTIEDYYPSGDMEGMRGKMGTGILLDYWTGTYDFDLSDLESPDESYGTVVASNSSEIRRLRTRAWFNGYMGGLTELWEAAQGDPAWVTFLGRYGHYYEELQGPFIFGTEVKSYDPYEEEFMTPDGGAYKGFMTGVMDTMVDGRFYGIYTDPDDDAGLLKGSFSGFMDPVLGVWEADGGLYPELVKEDMGPAVPVDQAELADGYMRIFGMSGGFGYSGSFIDSDTRHQWTTSEENPGGTLGFEGQGWGAWYLMMGRDNEFSNPQGSNSWSAKLGGEGEFGTWRNPQIPRYWLGDVALGDWSNGRLYGNLTGKMQSHGSMGDLTGEVLGSYDQSEGNWQGVASGTWSITPKKFGSSTQADLTHSRYSERGWFEYTNGDSYYYDYSKEEPWGYTKHYKTSDNKEYYEHYYIGDYWGSGLVRYEDNAGGPKTYDPWDPSTFDWTSLEAPPDPPDGVELDYSWRSSRHSEGGHGWMSGRMGGAESLWDGNPTPVEFLGEYWNEGRESQGIWYAGDIHSWNYLDDTCTDYDDPAGAYQGMAAGIHYGGPPATMRGRFLGLYIDPDLNEGYIKGNLAGNAYMDVHMHEMEGELILEQVKESSETGLALGPSELSDLLYQGGMWQSQSLGDRSISGAFDAGGALKGSVHEGGKTYAVENPGAGRQAAYDWGIYGIRFYGGGDSPSPSWSAVMGGKAEFGRFVTTGSEVLEDTGLWMSDIQSGKLSGGILEGTAAGRFLTEIKAGTMDGDFLGTYDSDTDTWEASSLGTWEGQPLKYMSHPLDGSELETPEYMYSGHWSSSTDSTYYHYNYSGDGTYAYTFTGDQTTGDGVSRHYYPDGTLEIHDTAAGTWSEDTWDTAGFDLSSLADPPDSGEWGQTADWTEEGAEGVHRGYAEGLLGGVDSLWGGSSAQAELLGESCFGDNHPIQPGYILSGGDMFTSHNSLNGTETTYDGGAYKSFMGATLTPGGGSLAVDALLGGVYIDPSGGAGILAGRLSGRADTVIHMMEAQGTIKAHELDPVSDFTADELWDSVTASEGYYLPDSGEQEGGFTGTDSSISLDDRDWESMRISGETWGVTLLEYAGQYSGQTADEWSMSMDFTESGVRKIGETTGTKWSDRKVEAHGAGAWINLDQAMTGVMGGELIGIYDPNQQTWQSVSIWNSIDTGRFIELAETQQGREALQGLHIPFIEIGRVDLAGNSDILSVSMNDVTFFAYSTGADPRVWATNSVTGSYTDSPNVGHNVPLSGGGLSADFKVDKWDSGKWGANVSGEGTLQRTDMSSGSVDVDFKGGVAGTYSDSDGFINGTGSGVVTP